MSLIIIDCEDANAKKSSLFILSIFLSIFYTVFIVNTVLILKDVSKFDLDNLTCITVYDILYIIYMQSSYTENRPRSFLARFARNSSTSKSPGAHTVTYCPLHPGLLTIGSTVGSLSRKELSFSLSASISSIFSSIISSMISF